MPSFDTLAELPIRVESYELEARDREYSPEFTRASTIVRLRGDGRGGTRRGRRLRRPRPHRPPRRRPGATTSPARPPSASSASASASSTSSPARRRRGRRRATTGAGPTRAPRSTSRCARAGTPCTRRWAWIRSRCASSARPASPPSATTPGRTPSAVRKRLEKYPGLRFKLDPENDWTPELIAELRELAGVDVLDLKGLYRGTPVDVETDPEPLRRGRRGVPRGLPRGPRHQRGDAAGARAAHGPGDLGRAAPLARRHRGPRVRAEGDQLKAVAVRVPARDALDLRALRGSAESRSTEAARAS